MMRPLLPCSPLLLVGCVGTPPPPPAAGSGDVGTSVTGSTPAPTTGGGMVDSTTGSGTTSSSSDQTTADTTAGPRSGWQHEITLSGHPQGPLEDVPVRVHFEIDTLADPTDPTTLRILDANEVPLPFEIEMRGEDAADLWVLVPSIETRATSIWMRYGSADPPPSPDASEIWSKALGVWHLHEGLTDSSPQANDGTVVGSSPTPGLVAGGRGYDGLSFDDLPPMGDTTAGTIQLWFRTVAEPDGEPISIFFHGSPDASADGLGEGRQELYLGLGWMADPSELRFRSYHDEDEDTIITSHPFDWRDMQWHHITATWDVNTELAMLYLDGVEVDQDDTPSSEYGFTQFLRLGGVAANPTHSFIGDLDEVRFWDFAMSPDRVAIEYAAQLYDFAAVGEALPIE